MALTMDITYENGESRTVKVKPGTIVRFEAAGKKLESEGLTWLYELAWFAEGRPDTFSEWVDSVDSVVAAEDAGPSTDPEVEPPPFTDGSVG